MKKRVVVTGLGVIACNGIGKDAYWDALVNGVSGISEIQYFDVSKLPSKMAGQVIDFDPLQFMQKKEVRHMGKFSQFGVAASVLAVQDASLKIKEEDRSRIGVVVGTSLAGLAYAEEQYDVYHEEGYKKVNPFTVSAAISSNCASQISIKHKITGPSLVLSTACASGTDAIGYARECIMRGETDMMICGGVETLLTEFTFGSFCATGILSTRNDNPKYACRPFERDRDGTVLAEGAGILIIEELNHAIARNAPIYAEIIGFGRTSDCYHPIIQEASGKESVRAINMALKDAEIEPKDVDYINAHGSGTVKSDRIETKVIKDAFGKHAYKIPISGTKSMIGHLQGGCGGPESVATVLSVKNDVITPTVGLENPDPECDLDYIPNKSRKQKVNIALKNSFGFGGKNTALVFKKYET